MTTKLTVRDETAGGRHLGEVTLELSSERMTVRELIRSRVYQEVKDFNVHRPAVYRGFVEPGAAEQALNGSGIRKTRSVDWKRQYQAALAGLECGQLIVTVNGRQVDNPDEEIELLPDTQITFLKLMPLIGG